MVIRVLLGSSSSSNVNLVLLDLFGGSAHWFPFLDWELWTGGWILDELVKCDKCETDDSSEASDPVCVIVHFGLKPVDDLCDNQCVIRGRGLICHAWEVIGDGGDKGACMMAGPDSGTSCHLILGGWWTGCSMMVDDVRVSSCVISNDSLEKAGVSHACYIVPDATICACIISIVLIIFDEPWLLSWLLTPSNTFCHPFISWKKALLICH